LANRIKIYILKADIMKEELKISTVFPASAKVIYDAWLDSKEHSRLSGGKAVIQPWQGGKFKAWDGYISGKNIKLQPYARIVQSWRTTEFHIDDIDSRIEILLEKTQGGTRFTLIHKDIPEGQGKKYEKGWKDFYLKPMKDYFKKESKTKS
jgi:activator of HSP90 ATPase